MFLGGGRLYSLRNKIKKVPGVLKRLFFGGGEILGRPTPPAGGRAGSENDTLLPMTMTRDRQTFWNGLPWRSQVIVRKPWRRKNKKQEKKKSDKTIRYSRRGMPNYV